MSIQDLERLAGKLTRVFHGKTNFLVEWEGPRNPVGARIGNTEVTRVKGAILLGENGEELGMLGRIHDSTGLTRRHQIMLIGTDSLNLAAPFGGVAYRLEAATRTYTTENQAPYYDNHQELSCG